MHSAPHLVATGACTVLLQCMHKLMYEGKEFYLCCIHMSLVSRGTLDCFGTQNHKCRQMERALCPVSKGQKTHSATLLFVSKGQKTHACFCFKNIDQSDRLFFHLKPRCILSFGYRDKRLLKSTAVPFVIDPAIRFLHVARSRDNGGRCV